MGKDKGRIPNPSAPCCRISSPALVQALDFPTCLPCQGVFVRADGELLEAHPRMMAWGKNCLKNFVDLVLTTQHAGLFFYLEAQLGNPNVRTFFFPQSNSPFIGYYFIWTIDLKNKCWQSNTKTYF